MLDPMRAGVVTTWRCDLAATSHTTGMHEITDHAKQRAMQENAKPASRKHKRLSYPPGANIESQFLAVLADRSMRDADFGIEAAL
jgi:hypothetical protein